MVSKKFTFNSQETSKVVKNAAIFFAPALLIFLTILQSGGGFEKAVVALQVWALNTAIDVTRKFVSGK